MKTLFVWDFHGVLEYDNENAVVEVTNQVLEEFGYDARLDKKTCCDLYGQKWSMFFLYLIPGVSEEIVKKMVNRGVEITEKTDVIYRHIKPTPDSGIVLRTIKEKGHENLVLSNTSPNALEIYIDSVGIREHLHHILGADIHQKEESNKLGLLKKFLNENKFNKIVVIDDFVSGIEMGIEFGAVTYHYRRNGDFEGSKADYKITGLREVLNEI